MADTRGLVAAALQGAGERGLTDSELVVATGLFRNTAAPTRNALLRAGKVVKTAARRPSEAGRPMIVWMWKGGQ